MKKTQKKAFTLVELLVVIAVLAILAAVSIPSYTAFITKANISADEQEIAQINSYLNLHGNVSSEAELKDAIKLAFGSSTFANLSPRSAKHGYHYWYDVNNNSIILKTYKEIEELNQSIGQHNAEPYANESSNNKQTFKDNEGNSFRMFGNYYLLDKGGSIIGEALNAILSGKDIVEKVSELEDIESKKHKEMAAAIIEKLKTVAIVSDEVTFVYNAEEVTTIYFTPEIQTVSSTVVNKNGNSIDFIAKEENIKEPVTLPDTVTSVGENALMFEGNTGDVYLNTSLNTPEEIAEIFKAISTNATIVVTEDTYTIDNDLLIDSAQNTAKNDAGEEIKLEFGNPVLSFDIVTPDNCDDYKTVTDTLYIAYNYSGVIKLSADNFVGVNEGNVSSRNVNWESSSDYVVIDENGNISLNGVPNAENCTATVTATAEAGNVSTTLTVHIVRPVNAEFTFASGSFDMTVDEDAPIEQITITYNGSTSDFAFTDFNFNLTVEDMVNCNKNVTITAEEGDLFTIENNVLTLLNPTDCEGITQKLTVQIGTVLSKTFEVSVNDISAAPFTVKAPFNNATFLYRVGNNNPVTLGLFFANTNPGKFSTLTITDVSIDDYIGVNTDFTAKVNGDTSDNGTWSISEDNWENTEIQFTGIGVARIQIGEVSIIVEVVDGKNVTDYSHFESGKNLVMLANIVMSDNSRFALQNVTLYGNDFILDVTQGNYTAVRYDGYSALSDNYRIYLNNGTLDNVRIVGNPFTGFSATASDPKNICNVLSTGNSKILNCLISYCAAPVRLKDGNLEIINTTLLGGSIANLDIRSGNVILDNVTTINQKSVNGVPASEGAVGLGIMAWYEGPTESTTITIKNKLTQYNYMSKEDFSAIPIEFNGFPLSSTFANAIFDANNGTGKFIYENGGKQWINTGIFSMSDAVGSDNIKHTEQSNNSIYSGASVSAKYANTYTFNGYLYSISTENVSLANPTDAYASEGQGVIYPSFSDINNSQNNVDKTEGSKEYCYYEDGTIYISFKDGGSKELLLDGMLQATKGPNTLSLANMYLDGEKINGNKITFDATGKHVLTFEFDDQYNYDINGSQVVKQHTKNVNISVSEAMPDAKNATFVFKDNTTTEKINVGNKTYISAKGVSATDKAWGYITVNGNKIYYPITEAQFKKSTTLLGGTEVQVFYYVFNGTVTITDYENNGLGAELTYNASTTTMPSNLTVVNGMEAKYTDINSACVDISKLTKDGPSGEVWDFSASSTVSGTMTHNGNLAHSSPSGLAVKSGTRDYDAITVAQFSYTDAAGATYSYFVGYFMPNQVSSSGGDGGNCVTPDTLITLADGTQKRVDELTGEEKLLVWNLETGSYDVANIVFVDSDKEADYRVIHLNFSDGSEVKVISEHGFFDMDLAKYVYIDEYNYADYIGHRFIKSGNIADNEWDVVTLESVTVETETTIAWSPVTSEHLCYYTNGILSMPGGIEGLFNIFDVNTDTMSYDLEKMEEDIAKYGLYTYDDFAGMIPEEAYVAFNGDWLKVAIEKGILTWDDIARYAERYIPLM